MRPPVAVTIKPVLRTNDRSIIDGLLDRKSPSHKLDCKLRLNCYMCVVSTVLRGFFFSRTLGTRVT